MAGIGPFNAMLSYDLEGCGNQEIPSESDGKEMRVEAAVVRYANEEEMKQSIGCSSLNSTRPSMTIHQQERGQDTSCLRGTERSNQASVASSSSSSSSKSSSPPSSKGNKKKTIAAAAVCPVPARRRNPRRNCTATANDDKIVIGASSCRSTTAVAEIPNAPRNKKKAVPTVLISNHTIDRRTTRSAAAAAEVAAAAAAAAAAVAATTTRKPTRLTRSSVAALAAAKAIDVDGMTVVRDSKAKRGAADHIANQNNQIIEMGESIGERKKKERNARTGASNTRSTSKASNNLDATTILGDNTGGSKSSSGSSGHSVAAVGKKDDEGVSIDKGPVWMLLLTASSGNDQSGSDAQNSSNHNILAAYRIIGDPHSSVPESETATTTTSSDSGCNVTSTINDLLCLTTSLTDGTCVSFGPSSYCILPSSRMSKPAAAVAATTSATRRIGTRGQPKTEICLIRPYYCGPNATSSGKTGSIVISSIRFATLVECQMFQSSLRCASRLDACSALRYDENNRCSKTTGSGDDGDLKRFDLERSTATTLASEILQKKSTRVSLTTIEPPLSTLAATGANGSTSNPRVEVSSATMTRTRKRKKTVGNNNCGTEEPLAKKPADSGAVKNPTIASVGPSSSNVHVHAATSRLASDKANEPIESNPCSRGSDSSLGTLEAKVDNSNMDAESSRALEESSTFSYFGDADSNVRSVAAAAEAKADQTSTQKTPPRPNLTSAGMTLHSLVPVSPLSKRKDSSVVKPRPCSSTPELRGEDIDVDVLFEALENEDPSPICPQQSEALQTPTKKFLTGLFLAESTTPFHLLS